MNKKIRLKQPLPDLTSRRWQQRHLRTFHPIFHCTDRPFATQQSLRFNLPPVVYWCVFASILLIGACGSVPVKKTSKVRFENPPAVGSWLQAQRELLACETEAAARYMANFGFLHPQCHQLEHIGPQEYQVQSKQRVELREGPMWLLRAQHQQTLYWVPIPWHNWL